MACDCKVFDKNGNLKKIIRNSDKLSGVTKNFLNQKSTKRALSYIRTMKDPKIVTGPKVRFYNKECILFAKWYFIPGTSIPSIVLLNVRTNYTEKGRRQEKRFE